MPHDRTGALVELGDYVHGIPYGGAVIGRVAEIATGTDTCNLQVAVPVLGGVKTFTLTAAETTVVLKADGTPQGPLVALEGAAH